MIHFWYASVFMALHILFFFYLPGIQNLAFFKTDDAEIRRKYQQKSTWLTGSTCPPSGNGICMWNPGFDYLLSTLMRDCSGVYCTIFTSHACVLNFLIPLWLTGEASAKYLILASPMQSSHYKIIPGWYSRCPRLWIHEKHPIAHPHDGAMMGFLLWMPHTKQLLRQSWFICVCMMEVFIQLHSRYFCFSL